jgi:LPXTG-motif cell wall-anchored protein
VDPDAITEAGTTDKELDDEQNKAVSKDGDVITVIQTDWREVVLTPDSDGKWTYTWSNLPVFTYDGTTKEYYYYMVQEEAVPSWNAARNETPTERVSDVSVSVADTTKYSTVYPKTITYSFTNSQMTFTLPEAGGIGDEIFYIIGGMLATLALLACIFRKKK